MSDNQLSSYDSSSSISVQNDDKYAREMVHSNNSQSKPSNISTSSDTNTHPSNRSCTDINNRTVQKEHDSSCKNGFR